MSTMMSRNLDETDQPSQQDLCRNFVTDSKLMFLCRAVEQCEQAQAHLRQNEDDQRRVKQLMDYNRTKLIELDLARKRMVQSNVSNMIGSDIFQPHTTEDVLRPRSSTKHLLPLQRPSQPTMATQFRAPEQRMASLTKQVDSVSPRATHDRVVSQNKEMGSQQTLSGGDNHGHHIACDEEKGFLKLRESTFNPAPMQTATDAAGTAMFGAPNQIVAFSKHTDSVKPNGSHEDSVPKKNQGLTGAALESSFAGVDENGIHSARDEDHELLLKLRNSTNGLLSLQQVSYANQTNQRASEQRMKSSKQVFNFTAKSNYETRTMSSQQSFVEGDDDSDEDNGSVSNSNVVPHWRYSFNFKDADVLFERGNFAYNHAGNRVYREYIKEVQEKYTLCKKSEKHLITTQVMHYIKNTCGGRFLSFDAEGSGKWEELSESATRRKIGQSLREKNKRYMPPARNRKNGQRIFEMFDSEPSPPLVYNRDCQSETIVVRF